MTDLISRADAIEEISKGVWNVHELVDRIKALPSAELTLQTPQTYGKSINPSNAEVVKDYISRADAIEAVRGLSVLVDDKDFSYFEDALKALPSADAEPKRVLQGYCKGANTIQTIRHEELKQIANTRKAVESADAVQVGDAEMDNCQVQAPQNYMQQSRHDDGRMTREEAIEVLKRFRKVIGLNDDLKRALDKRDIPLLDMAIEALSADAVPQLKQTDTLIIADALRYLAKDTERHLVDRTRADALRQQFLKYGASMCKGGAE